MKRSNLRKISFLLSVILTAPSMAACGEGKIADETSVNDTGTTSGNVTGEQDEFADMDLGGQEIRIYTSTNADVDSRTSNYLIEGPDEETGDVVQDSAYFRNRSVEETLNVKLVYTDYDVNYASAAAEISKLVMSGDDLYDIIISKLYPMAGLSAEGNFRNIANAPYIDTTQDYWYDGYMSELSLDGKKEYILAGDYFIDVLRSAHALYFNKDLLETHTGDGDALYKDVLDNKWTFDTFLTYVNGMYSDLNGNSEHDIGDQYGYVAFQTWGPMIPFLVSAGLKLTEKTSDGKLKIAMNNENSVRLLELLNKIFYSEATCVTEFMKLDEDAIQTQNNLFRNGRSLFLGSNRLGSLELLRDVEFEVGIVPYPKFDPNQKEYVSSSHDTTEIGVIPVTCQNFENVCAVLEVLNRETAKLVIPAYYETGLKVKYSRDDYSSQMIDIIHGNIGGSFALAYSNNCDAIFQQTAFYLPLSRKSNDFSSNFAKYEAAAQAKLDKLVENFSSLDE